MLGRHFSRLLLGANGHFSWVYVYIYIFLKLRIRYYGLLSQTVGSPLFHVNRFTFGCGNPCFGFKVAAATSPATKLAVHNNCSPYVFWSPKKKHLHKNGELEDLEVGLLKDLMFFFVSQLFSFVLPFFIGELDC